MICENAKDDEVFLSEMEVEPLIVNKKNSRRLYTSNNIIRRMKHRIFIVSSIFVVLLFIHILILSNVKMYGKHEVTGWSRNTSRETAEYILPNENTTLLEPTLCHSETGTIFLLIVVCSSASNFEARQVIRETWGNTTQFNYPLFQKFHGHSNDGNYLDINNRHWKAYIEVSHQYMLSKYPMFYFYQHYS
jgi:beta-1,3-galactosyltransferase 1